ncbi:integrase [Dokdonia pacifica]|uniref:Phage integrase family protein n=1 Tax=Dokdonia pacifica TaxID=1627892 RepID=A0A239DP01_9FLAO|nr:hypothetical protein [Dokdonia pacifica]GGG37269.1 integrase [Dokdonia pacifica]SNS33909.1 hypothetical protein SAMN06265376_111109 [Dokdonia pacifica]
MKQPILRFYLDGHPNKNGERQIFLDINIGYSEIDRSKKITKFNSDRKKYKPIKISTLCRIKPENFGKHIQKGKRSVFVFDEKTFNQYSRNNRSIKTRISKIKSTVDDVTNHFFITEINPTPSEFKDLLEIKLGRKKKEITKQKTVLEFLYQKIENDREAIKMKKKDAPSENYIKTYVSLSRMFENYHIINNTEILFSDFNDTKFYWNFFKIADDVYRGEVEVNNPNQSRKQRRDPTGYSTKSINKYIKLLHRILSLGKKSGANITLDLSDGNLFLENPPAQKDIYLNEKEIQSAINNTIGDNELENARQYLIMASLMGLRVEDMEALHLLSPEVFKGKKEDFYGVKIKIGKTKSDVIIPLLKPVRDILKVNNNRFPAFNEQIINVNIKRVCKLLEIETLEEKTKISFNQGKIVTTGIPKYELVSTHDCRRSFITNLLENNINGERIKYITHPKKQDSKDMIALYNKASLIDKAEMFLFELNTFNVSEIYCY